MKKFQKKNGIKDMIWRIKMENKDKPLSEKNSDDICECGHERKEHPVYNLYGSIICKQFKRSKA